MGRLGSKTFREIILFVSCLFVTSVAMGRQCATDIQIYALLPSSPFELVEPIYIEHRDELEPYVRGKNVRLQLLERGGFGYVAVRGEEVLGYLTAEHRNDYLSISSVAVKKGSEHHGIGSALMEKLLADASHMSDVNFVRIIVPYNDSPARSFFESNGLEQTEIIPGKFDLGKTSGVVLKKIVHDRVKEAEEAQRALQPVRKPVAVAVKLAVIDISPEDLRKLDPTLEHANDKFDDE